MLGRVGLKRNEEADELEGKEQPLLLLGLNLSVDWETCSSKMKQKGGRSEEIKTLKVYWRTETGQETILGNFDRSRS